MLDLSNLSPDQREVFTALQPGELVEFCDKFFRLEEFRGLPENAFDYQHPLGFTQVDVEITEDNRLVVLGDHHEEESQFGYPFKHIRLMVAGANVGKSSFYRHQLDNTLWEALLHKSEQVEIA